ncbi:hypothetical protein L0F63_003641 [Massospora cicadina]|nr:hypothetical protein L0F63_003641 [Massospora cicadina]
MGSRVYFGRLARDCRERDIEKLLRSYGEVREIHLRSGYGFVEFRDYRDAEDAIYDLHGREFLGERLIVEHARSSSRGVREPRRPPPPIHTAYRLIVENVAAHASWQV